MSYVVATDGSTEGDRAVTTAAEHAAALDEPLEIVHVLTPDTELVDGEIVLPGDDAAIESGERVLEQASMLVEDADIDVALSTALLTGRPATAITDHATDSDADAIFLGNRGLSDAREQVVGSVAKTVVDKADRPVMVVK